MALWTVVSGRQSSHVTGILAASVDEEDWSGEGEQNQQNEEKQTPWFNPGQGRAPQYPQEGEVEEDAVSACDGGKTSA